MKTVSIMEAQHNLSKVLREIQPGDRVAITRHKKIVAELIPPPGNPPPPFPDFETRAKKTWGGLWQGSTSDELLRESRGNR